MTEPDVPCPFCKDARWVCEAHPNKPWGIEGECGCGEPGMPCRFCNPCGGPDDAPDMQPGFIMTLRRGN